VLLILSHLDFFAEYLSEIEAICKTVYQGPRGDDLTKEKGLKISWNCPFKYMWSEID
jgi:hypothetical protein